MMLGIQLIGIIFALGLLYASYTNLKKKSFTINEYLFWSVISIAIIVSALFPSIFNPIIETLSFKRTLDFLTVIGFLFLIAGLMYLYVVVRNLNTRLERLAMKIAQQNEELEESVKESGSAKKAEAMKQKKE